MSSNIAVKAVRDMGKLERELLDNYEQPKLELIHTFTEGLYTRELHIPAGVLAVGKRHRGKTLNMLIKGKLSWFDNGEEFVLEAPFIGESEALSKKIFVTHTDCVWVNVHPTTCTNVDELEELYTISEDEYVELIEGGLQCRIG